MAWFKSLVLFSVFSVLFCCGHQCLGMNASFCIQESDDSIGTAWLNRINLAKRLKLELHEELNLLESNRYQLLYQWCVEKLSKYGIHPFSLLPVEDGCRYVYLANFKVRQGRIPLLVLLVALKFCEAESLMQDAECLVQNEETPKKKLVLSDDFARIFNCWSYEVKSRFLELLNNDIDPDIYSVVLSCQISRMFASL